MCFETNEYTWSTLTRVKTPQALQQIPKYGCKIYIDFSHYSNMLCLDILVHVLEDCWNYQQMLRHNINMQADIYL